MKTSDPPNQLIAIAAEGSRVRRAIEILAEASQALEGAIRRAIPFVGRNALPVKVHSVQAVSLESTIEALTKPWHLAQLTIEPGGSAGIIAFDGAAVAMVLDGLLGGEGKAPPALTAPLLTTTQTALMARVSTGVCGAFSEALARAGLTLAPRAKSAPEAHGETAPITTIIEVGDGEHVGRIVLAIAKDALLARASGETTKASESLDPRIAGTVERIEVELVAELGRARMRLHDIARLQPGDTLRLDAPLTGSVDVLAQGKPIFSGRPTAINGQIAVRLDRGHEG
ncbi:MAG: FliM/FliN family flagellar motor switch protein [Polyangiaceae bacterium]